jgi:GAF domain-containing protein
MDHGLPALRELEHAAGSRTEKAQEAIRVLRAFGGYRWAALYDVSATEIAVIAWDGPEAPAHPRFPVGKGLNGVAVASGNPVIVQDVSSDARYLTTIGGTCGEMIQPVISPSGKVVGTIDVESDRVNAFSAFDEQLLTACARDLQWLWQARDG